jgi:hypothetical protein
MLRVPHSVWHHLTVRTLPSLLTALCQALWQALSRLSGLVTAAQVPVAIVWCHMRSEVACPRTEEEQSLGSLTSGCKQPPSLPRSLLLDSARQRLSTQDAGLTRSRPHVEPHGVIASLPHWPSSRPTVLPAPKCPTPGTMTPEGLSPSHPQGPG